MAKYFTTLAAPSADSDTFDSIHYHLRSAEIDAGPQTIKSAGLLIFFDREKDWEWVCSETEYAKSLHSRVMVIWGDSSPLKSTKCWQLAGSGADEVIQWQETNACTQMISRLRRWFHIEECLANASLRSNLAGSCPLWLATLRQLIEISLYSQAPILIMGESGTGKEMAAKLLHQMDIRPHKQNLTLLDCSSVVPELSGSEFFGHEKGAFTNAVCAREGAFENANNGTLFLDEVGELPPHLQAELLRVTQEGTYKRLGSNQWKRTDFRLISATNRDLKEMVREKVFRQDLFYRISTWICRMPSLAERKDDIPELVETFLAQLLPDNRKRPVIDPLVMAHLCLRDYPGNVRELRQVVTRMVNNYTGTGQITLGDLSPCDRPCFRQVQRPALDQPDFANMIKDAINEGMGLKSIVQHTTQVAKDIAIAYAGGNIQQASSLLQVSDRTLQLHLAAEK